ncbi:MAG TPA: phosphoglycerate kinase, partial [Rhabdochlamydiaceae bacterium]
MKNTHTLSQLPIKGKKVLLRVDFNVPLSPEGKITDDTRIREALPTIRYILKQGGSLILMSHLGRPKGKKDPQFSLVPCQKRLAELLGIPVLFAPDCIGPQAEKLAAALEPGQVLMLENLRFYSAEEDPDSDPTFAKKLSSLGDLYVNDAFGTAHRKHASTATIASYFPGKSAIGLLMEKEVEYFDRLLKGPARPFYALVGGAKIGTKLGVLSALVSKVDALYIGG